MRLFKREPDLRFGLLAAHDKTGTASGAAPPAEQALEEIAEPAPPAAATKCIAKVAKPSLGAFPAWRWPKFFACFPISSELVVALAFVGIGQDFVGLVDFF